MFPRAAGRRRPRRWASPVLRPRYPGPTAPDTILIDRGSDVRFAATATDTETATDAAADAEAPIATLPFGKVLGVAGFRCNVQEVTGVSCGSESSAKGFTFSAEGFTAVYTDVPQ
jgi:hypothetical protein